MDALAPHISRARYAKDKYAVHCPSDGSGLKTRAMRLVEAIAKSARYSGREHAYIVSQRQAERIAQMYEQGFDGTFIKEELVPPRHEKGE